VLIVGQNCGAEEDLAGEPFVGPSGKLLKSMLADAGFQTDDYRLSNAVRCRTPKNRPPEHKEILACRPHLIEEVQSCKPSAIIALGDVALTALTGLSGISSKRGQPLPLLGAFGYTCEVYAAWHPAYVMRVPMSRATVVSDLRRVRDRGLEQEEIAWTHDAIACDRRVAYDIETYDEEGNITEEMTSIAVCGGSDLALVSRDRKHAKQIVREIARYSKGVTISHFGWDFDDKKTGLRSDYDTAALAYLMDETQPLGLESLCVKYLGARGWKEARDGAKLGTEELKVYNARDAVLTRRLFDYEYQALQETTRAGVPRIRVAESILRPLRLALDACSSRGIFINAREVAAEKERQVLRVAESLALVNVEAHKALGAGAFDKPLKTKVKQTPFNPGSTLHVGAVLSALGFTNLPKTGKKRQIKTDEETLEMHAGCAFTDALLAWRQAEKRMSTYILPYERAAASESGRIFSQYTVIRVLTGRTSARGRNIQNLDRELKKFFSAPEGRVLVRADYQQIEFWVAMWMAGVERLIVRRADDSAFDPHTYFASIMYRCSEADILTEAAQKKASGDPNSRRQIAKSAHFALLYMGGPQTLIDYAAGYGIMLTRDEAQAIYDAFHRAYPEVRDWWGRVKAEMNQYGYVENPTGRRRHFGDVSLLKAGGMFESAHREATNALVQGFATGDISELGLIACHEAGLPVVGFIHDEVLLEFKTEALQHKDIVERAVSEAMIDAPVRALREKFNVDFPKHLLAVDFTYSA
jgi:uracil-DNA glycosylase family 4